MPHTGCRFFPSDLFCSLFIFNASETFAYRSGIAGFIEYCYRCLWIHFTISTAGIIKNASKSAVIYSISEICSKPNALERHINDKCGQHQREQHGAPQNLIMTFQAEH